MIVFIGFMIVAITLAQALPCKPVSQSWTLHEIPGAKCASKPHIQFAGSGLNLGTDVLILLMPLKYLWGMDWTMHSMHFDRVMLTSCLTELSLNKRRRIMIIAIFSSGALSVIPIRGHDQTSSRLMYLSQNLYRICIAIQNDLQILRLGRSNL